MAVRLRSRRTSRGALSFRSSTAPAHPTAGKKRCRLRMTGATATPTAGCLRPPKSSSRASSENDVRPEDDRDRGLRERREIAAVLAGALVDQAEVELPRELARRQRILLAEDHLLTHQRQPVDREFAEEVDARVVEPGKKRALEVEVGAAQAEVQRIGDVAVAVVAAAHAEAPVQALL